MAKDVWCDGGEFNDLLQKHVKEAVECFLKGGFWALNVESLELRRYAAEPCGFSVSIQLADLIDEELRDYVPGNVSQSIDILSHDFGGDLDPALDEARGNLDKLQRCLRILKGA